MSFLVKMIAALTYSEPPPPPELPFHVNFDDGAKPSDWIENTSGGGTITYNHTPAIDGAYSVSFDASSTTFINLKSPIFAPESNIQGFFQYNRAGDSAVGTNILFEFKDDSDAMVIRLGFDGPNNRLTLLVGSVSLNSAAGSFVLGVNYNIWIQYIKGTGGDAIGRVWLSTTLTKPGSPTLEITNGTSTTDVVQAAIYSNNRGHEPAVYDNIMISTNDISSNPF